MAAKLKVFRTPIGFHDAYVAAPSQKAALAAWGAEADLFARGQAEKVTDPELARAALADPGKVVRVPRGSTDQHLAEAARTQPRKSRRKTVEALGSSGKPAPKKRKAPPPKPSRAQLDAAEDERDRQERAFEAALQDLETERARIAAEITELRRSHARRQDALDARAAKARQAYDTAMEKWRDA